MRTIKGNMLCACEDARHRAGEAQKTQRTGNWYSEKRVVYEWFFCDSKYLLAEIQPFTSKIRLESNAAN